MTQADSTAMHTDLIEAWLEHLTHRRLSPRTVATYGEAVRAAHQWLPYGLPIATTAELEQWLAAQPQWSLATRHLRTRAITYFFRWAVRTSRLDWDPSTELDTPRLPRHRVPPATTEEVTAILTTTGGAVWLASTLAAYAGLRCIEVTRLCREHVTHELVTVHGKGDHHRQVPTHPQVWAAVRELPAGRLVPMREQPLSALCWRTYRRHGVQVSLHQLRKWHATELWRAGVDLETVRQLLGHTSLTTTQRYLGADPGRMAAAVGALPVLTAGAADGAAATAPPPPAPAAAAPATGPPRR